MFGFGKKKEEKRTAECSCNCSCPTSEAAENKTPCCCETDPVCCIKVLGAGCKSCHELYENAKKAVTAAGLSIEVEYITDMEKIMSYGVMSMPALVVNEKVVSMGKVLKPADIAMLFSRQ